MIKPKAYGFDKNYINLVHEYLSTDEKGETKLFI